MNVKISVKKLFNMEQLIIALKDGQKMYREKMQQMSNEHEDLKEDLKEAEASLKRGDERCNAYMKEVEEYKRDIEILSRQLNHTRQVSDNWSKSFVEANDKCKELKKLFEEKVHSHLQQLAEINELKKDRKDWEDAARSAADNL